MHLLNTGIPVERDAHAEITPLTVSVGQAAQILGVSEPTIYRLVARRLLRVLPGLRHKRITHHSIKTYCSENFPTEPRNRR